MRVSGISKFQIEYQLIGNPQWGFRGFIPSINYSTGVVWIQKAFDGTQTHCMFFGYVSMMHPHPKLCDIEELFLVCQGFRMFVCLCECLLLIQSVVSLFIFDMGVS